jgi:hypothetical protein
MTDAVPGTRPVVVVSSSWWGTGSETAFVTRAVAGALSRHAPVEVFCPAGRDGGPRTEADGLFDVQREAPAVSPSLVVCEPDGAAATRAYPSAPAAVIGAGPSGAGRWSPGPPRPGEEGDIGLHVAVNPLAAARPHNGLGFTDYLLVLTDRGGSAFRPELPGDTVAWLAAAFPRRHLVVAEAGSVTVWRCRTLRGVVTVDTRPDLWRLMAHARATVDLGPGPLVARECVESLRFGTPVVVPAGTAASRLAAAGGGLSFADVEGLFRAVDEIDDPARRAELSARGRAAADAAYGDTDAFVARVGRAMDLAIAA